MHHLSRLFLLIILLPLFTFGQTPEVDSLKSVLLKAQPDTNKVKTLIELSKKLRGSAPDQARDFAQQAFDLSTELEFDKGLALGYKWIGMYHFDHSDYVKAEGLWEKSLEVYKRMDDPDGISNMLNNLGSVYFNTGDNAKALEYFLPSLDAAEKAKDKLRVATTTQNIGLVYMSKAATYDQALIYLKKGLVLAEELNDLDNISSCNTNIGEIHLNRGNDSLALAHFFRARKAAEPSSPNLPYIYDKIGDVMKHRDRLDESLIWYKMAAAKAREQGNKIYIVTASNNMGDVYRLKDDPQTALRYLDTANALATEIRAVQEQRFSYKGLAKTYSDLSDFKKAFQYQVMYSNLADSLSNLKTDSIQSKFEVGLREKEIDLLTKDQKIKEDELHRQKLVRNAFLAGFALVSALIFILYRDYRNKIKTNKILDSQKAEIESLLLNILPAEVAQELQKTGEATPRFYDSVSVLFTDFKSFTVIADRLSPQEVVAELNACFRSFDEIVKKWGLEKIKTIGDSYMCAGGIPVALDNHPVKIIRAAMEIRDWVHKMNEDRAARGLDIWEMRIGIHVGPLVAGVVGKMKFAYDIWGSTVNVASRMESNGHPGEINISAATYELVKDTFACTYRGKIYAKNVGEIDMYFVNNEQPGL